MPTSLTISRRASVRRRRDDRHTIEYRRRDRHRDTVGIRKIRWDHHKSRSVHAYKHCNTRCGKGSGTADRGGASVRCEFTRGVPPRKLCQRGMRKNGIRSRIRRDTPRRRVFSRKITDTANKGKRASTDTVDASFLRLPVVLLKSRRTPNAVPTAYPLSAAAVFPLSQK